MKHAVRLSCALLALSATGFGLSGCDLAKNELKIDRSGNMETQDYRDALASRLPKEGEKVASADSKAPDLQPYVAGPSKDLKPMPLVSISVNQTVPLRDALFELATQANYDIQLDPRITGSVIYTAHDKPFDQVIDEIATTAGLRYKFDNNSVRVEMDTPFIKTYKIDYLNYVRKNTSSIKNDVSVVTGGGANTGSSFEAASTSEADFWAELSTNLTQILNVPQAQSKLTTKKDPTITAATPNPQAANVEPVVATDKNGKKVVQVTPPAATLQVQSLPTTGDDAGAQAPAQVPAGQSPDGSSFAVNKQGGIISVNATERQHKKIASYLDTLRRAVTSQVLIEAKVLEVDLNDEFSAGVDWQLLKGLIGDGTAGFASGATTSTTGLIGQVRPDFQTVSVPNSNFRVGVIGKDATAVVDAVQRFGTVKALASPRLTVLNNQSAALNVANNQVYFEIQINVSQGTNGSASQTTVNSTIHNVPEGVLINVQPSINLDDQTVSMSVRPTVTRIVSYVDDPAVAFELAAAGITSNIANRVPVVNVQEMDSVVKVNSGDALVMGGLMQDRTDSTQQGIPVLSEIPMLGAAFRNQVDSVKKTELVVFLKATIIDGSNVGDTDKDLYKKFSEDRRPLKM